jgi:hypothetical protein
MASRRQYLAAVGGLGTVGIAGCSSLPVGGSEGGWSERYGASEKRTFLWNTLPLSDGYLLTGSQSTAAQSQDALVIKLDGDHEVEWEETLGGEGWDWLETTVSTEDGFVAFGSKSGNAWLVGLDEDGDVEWEETYGTEDTRTWGWRMTSAGDGGFVLVGQVEPGSGPQRGWVRKTGEEGETDWTMEYSPEDGGQTRLSGVVRDGDGYLVAGHKEGDGSRVGTVVRVTGDGEIDWEESYEEGRLGSIVADGDGYIAVGRSGDDEAQIVAITADGDERWEETYDEADRGYFTDIAPVSGGLFGDDGYIAVGSARITESEPRRQLAWVVGLDGNGEVKTEHVADEEVESMVFAVAETDGGYVVTGSVNEEPDSETNSRDGWVFETSSADAVDELDTDVF